MAARDYEVLINAIDRSAATAAIKGRFDTSKDDFYADCYFHVDYIEEVEFIPTEKLGGVVIDET